jgi:hypothetical protein
MFSSHQPRKMKKWLLLVCLLALSTATQAQGLRIGFKGGANYSNLSGKLETDDIYDSKLGLHGGVMLNFNLVDRFFSFQPEILYSNKGYEFNNTSYLFNNITYQNDGRVSYNYIDVPVLAKVNAGALFFELGPQASYLLSVRKDYREIITIGSAPVTFQHTDNNKEDLNRFEVGYAAGLGFQTQNGVMLGLRYNGNFSRFAKESYFNGRLTNARHSVFQLYLGFLLPG